MGSGNTVSQKDIEQKTAEIAEWWIAQRFSKLEKMMIDTMTINPFMAPFVYNFHNCSSSSDFFNVLMIGHLMTGHATGFGKLVDEKILPRVFDSKKLDASFRREFSLEASMYDEIDHLIPANNSYKLISLKAGKWTIQLTMAVQLNTAFADILATNTKVKEIIVGVFYGNQSSLTDKYDILRGVNRGKNHDVTDLTNKVFVKAGNDFWKWINNGEDFTQRAILNGILLAIESSDLKDRVDIQKERFEKLAIQELGLDKIDGSNDVWHQLLDSINT